MAATSTPVILTQASTGHTFELMAGNIVSAEANGANSKVFYFDNGATVKSQIVTESLATIATDSQTLISVTDVAGTVSYINPDRIINYGPYFTPITGSDITNNITAHAGGGQGSAVALTTQFNVVTVCATNGDSVKLEAAVANLVQVVYNNTAHTLAVFPASGDSINGGTVNASVNVLAGNQAIFTAADSTNWVESAPIQSQILFDATGATNRIFQVQESPATLTAAIDALLVQVILADMTYTNATNITAAGTNQGTATQLTAVEFNNVTTVASGTGVLLVAASAGLRQIVKNSGANALTVYPASGDAIDAGSANAGVLLQVGQQIMFSAIDATTWQSDLLTDNDYSVTTGITAHAGGGQGSAVALVSEYNNVTVCATAGDSVLLLPALIGRRQIVKNNGAKPLAVFPSGSGTIDGGSASASVTILPGNQMSFNSISATDWETNSTTTNVQNNVAVAINATATATAAQVASGYITSTSAAAVTITLPTGTLLGAALAAKQGTVHDLYVDNTAGANTVTVAVAVNGILSAAAAANAASQGLLTVPSGVTGQGCFRLMFSSATAYTFTRIA